MDANADKVIVLQWYVAIFIATLVSGHKAMYFKAPLRISGANLCVVIPYRIYSVVYSVWNPHSLNSNVN